MGDNKTNEPDNEEKSFKECEREEEKEEITWSKALEKADQLKMYYQKKAILYTHPKSQVIRKSR